MNKWLKNAQKAGEVRDDSWHQWMDGIENNDAAGGAEDREQWRLEKDSARRQPLLCPILHRFGDIEGWHYNVDDDDEHFALFQLPHANNETFKIVYVFKRKY